MDRLLLYNLVFCLMILPAFSLASDDYAKARQAMVKEIRQDVQQTSLYLDKDVLNPRVMNAMATVPRHEFVPIQERSYAYENRPLPIGHGQTISQPYIVAIMTDLLKTNPDQKVLEIGTGSGYQAAILSRLVNQVYTIEIIPELGEQARTRFANLHYDNIHTRIGDGYYGWKEAGPFDAIVVTAAASHVPPPLLQQLKAGGRIVIPVGSQFLVQHLVIVDKHDDGQITTRQILPVLFVPLTGQH